MARRRSIPNFLTNWRESRLPLPIKIALTARNLSLRVLRRDTCCGHTGEPGC